MANPLTSSIGIAKPPGIVWNLLTTVEEISDWYDDWDAVEYTAPEDLFELGRLSDCCAVPPPFRAASRSPIRRIVSAG